MKRTSWAFLTALAAAAVGFFITPESLRVFVYDGIVIAAAIAMIVGAIRNRREPFAAWLLLAFAIALTAAGEIVYGESQQVPSLADMLYISAYPLLGLGLYGIAPWRPNRRSQPTLLVAGVITVVVAAICFGFLVLPAGSDGTGGFSSQLVGAGYPILDLILLALLVRAAVPERLADPSFGFLAVALLLMLAADVGYALEDFGNAYVLGSSLDAGWMLSYAFLAAALLHPGRDDEPVRVVIDAAPQKHTHSAGRTATAVREVATLSPSHFQTEVRFGVIVALSGRMLLLLGGIAVIAATAWLALDVALVGGAFVTTGAFMTFASTRTA